MALRCSFADPPNPLALAITQFCRPLPQAQAAIPAGICRSTGGRCAVRGERPVPAPHTRKGSQAFEPLRDLTAFQSDATQQNHEPLRARCRKGSIRPPATTRSRPRPSIASGTQSPSPIAMPHHDSRRKGTPRQSSQGHTTTVVARAHGGMSPCAPGVDSNRCELALELSPCTLRAQGLNSRSPVRAQPRDRQRKRDVAAQIRSVGIRTSHAG